MIDKNIELSKKPFDINRFMDASIKKTEDAYSKKEQDFYIGIEFTQEEKRLLVPIFNDRMQIAKFYQRIQGIQKQGGIKNIIKKYKEESQESRRQLLWIKLFTNKLLLPKEYELFFQIIKKIENKLNNDKKTSIKIDKIFNDALVDEKNEKVLERLMNGNDPQIETQKKEKRVKQDIFSKNEVKRILKEKIEEAIRGRYSLDLDEFMKNERGERDVFVKNIIKEMFKDKKFVSKNIETEEKRRLFITMNNLIGTVVSEMVNN